MMKIKKMYLFLRGMFPRKLPCGLAEFKSFSDDIFLAYNLPNLPSYQNAIATMIMHLGPTVSHKSPIFFAKSVYKAQANQTAYEIIQAIKEEENKKKELEATKLEEASSVKIPDETI